MWNVELMIILRDLFRHRRILGSKHAPSLRMKIPILSADFLAGLVASASAFGMSILVNSRTTNFNRHNLTPSKHIIISLSVLASFNFNVLTLIGWTFKFYQHHVRRCLNAFGGL